MPEQCHAMLKPIGVIFPHRCPAPSVPGEIYCPFHMVIGGRIKERARIRGSFFEEVRRKFVR